MNGKLNIALIGAGGMGKRWANGLRHARGVAVRVVCDKDMRCAEKVGKQFHNCRFEMDINKVAKADDIDIAIIALPHVLLSRASLLFLKNGKHVLCEKPGGIAQKEIKQAIKEARKNNVHYAVGYNHRFHDAFLKARKEFEKGTVGRLMFIRARYGFGGRKGYEKEWRLNKKAGGGELMDQCVHMIDLCSLFMGSIQTTRGFTGNLFWHGTAEDNAFLLLKNKTGNIASIHASYSEWRPAHTFEIYGTKGYLVVDGLGRKYKGSNGGNERLIVGKRTTDFKANEKIIACDTSANKSLTREIESFISGIKGKKTPIATGEEAFRVLHNVQTIYAQNKNKK